MVNPDSLVALFSSSGAVAIYGFLGNYIGEKVLDHLLTTKPEQLKSSELISRQLYETLDEALRTTCTEYEWEYDDHAISETFSEGRSMWAGIDSSAKLVSALGFAIGDDYSGLITEEVAEFWLDAFSRGVACRQELFNYLHSQENRQIQRKHGDVVDNRPQYPCFITDSPDAAVDELIGRESELETLYDLVVDQHKKLMLSGVGGLGKTELVKLFLERLAHTETKVSGIEEIAWISYDNQSICISVQRALHLQCEPSEVWQILQEKATQMQSRLLLVIDNIEKPEEDEYLKKLSVWDQGDYDKACSTLEYIINTTEQMGSNYLVDLFDFSFNYARCLHEKGNDALSKVYYNKCINLWESMSGGGSRNLCLAFQEYGDILFSEGSFDEALPKYESAFEYNTEDWYIQVDLVDSIAACMMKVGQRDASLQKFAWLLRTLAEDDIKDKETKFQLCSNLVCVLDSVSEEEIEYKEALLNLIKDDPTVLSYASHYLDDLLPDSTE